jgi:2-iminobutanoate/2-iminopropanoate deaminase
MLTVIHTKEAPAAVGPYSQGMRVGDLVFVSGQLPINPETGELVSSTIEAATAQSLENCKAIVEAAGSTFNHVVKVEVFLKDMNDFAKMNEVYATYFVDHKPARAAIEVARLPKDAIVEIQMIAHVE